MASLIIDLPVTIQIDIDHRTSSYDNSRLYIHNVQKNINCVGNIAVASSYNNFIVMT